MSVSQLVSRYVTNFCGRARGEKNKNQSRPLYQTQPEVYGKVKWMATSARVNLFFNVINNYMKIQISSRWS